MRYADPEARRRTSEAKKAAFRAKPDSLARVKAASDRNLARAHATTDYSALHRGTVARMSPEERRRKYARSGLKAGLGGSDLSLYEFLTERQKLPAAEARRIVEEQGRATIRRIDAEMRARHERQKRESY